MTDKTGQDYYLKVSTFDARNYPFEALQMHVDYYRHLVRKKTGIEKVSLFGDLDFVLMGKGNGKTELENQDWIVLRFLPFAADHGIPEHLARYKTGEDDLDAAVRYFRQRGFNAVPFDLIRMVNDVGKPKKSKRKHEKDFVTTKEILF